MKSTSLSHYNTAYFKFNNQSPSSAIFFTNVFVEQFQNEFYTLLPSFIKDIEQCFSTAGTRPDTGPTYRDIKYYLKFEFYQFYP
jgi:hypothetical protein